MLYTGKAWKHHISSDFDDNQEYEPYSNGAGAGGAIFLDYDYMIEYLKNNGREWHIAELDCVDTPISFDFDSPHKARILVDWGSKEGFKKLK